MVKHKSQAKPKKGGVDFKKIKRKIGRRLPPPKNTTNTEIKYKAIALPEQSIVSEKEGFAVSKKGLTLKELLHQTSHHNAKARKEALLGIKDIMLKHPAELKSNKLAVVEKLRERISDDDKFVRETLYQLFKSVIFPGCAQENQGPLASLMMAYIFNAMTHLAIEVRVTAFKFFDLVLQFSPSSFSLYAVKILQNYGDILSKNQFLEEKSKLKSILDGLIRCLSLLPCNKGEDRSVKNDSPTHLILHAFEPETPNESLGFTDITNKLEDLLSILIGCFMDFMPTLHSNLHLDMQLYDCMLFLLQSVDLIVGFFVGRICETLPDVRFLPHLQLPDKVTYNQFISPMILKKLWDAFPLNLAHHLSVKDNDQIFKLNTVITKIFLKLSNLDCSLNSLLEKFLDFIESSLITEAQSGKAFHEKLLLPIVPYIPKLTMHISGDWRFRILQVFTEVSKNCSPESSMKLSCLTAIEEMLGLGRSSPYTYANDPMLLHYQIEWIKDFPSLLLSLDNKKPLCSKTVLRLQLLMGQSFPANSPLSQEFDALQFHFRDFFSSQTENDILYGPFVRLPADIQELSLSCLYYFTYMDSPLLQSLVSCCLCEDLEPYLVYRILEVLHSAFRAGHIQLADYASFYITLLARFHVYPEKTCASVKRGEKSNHMTFKHITRIACSYLSQIGDTNLIFQMLEKIIIDHICREIAMENKCGFLRLLVSLDAKPSRLSDHSIAQISSALPKYLINVTFNIGSDSDESMSPIYAKRWRYYLLPSFHLFHGSKRLLNTVLNVMGSWLSEDSSTLASDPHLSSVSHSTLASAIGSILLHMCGDDKMKRVMLQSKIEIENILLNLLNLQSHESTRLTLVERRNIQTLHDRLRAITISEVLGHR